jgi:D-inositol-3-phosphate glycosyltransferase
VRRGVNHPGGVGYAFFRLPKEPGGARLGLAGRRLVLFLGRLQPIKGADLAIRAMARAILQDGRAGSDLALVVMGGPSGADGRGYVERLRRLAAREGIEDRVRFLDPSPHQELPWVYSAAEVLLMPSRSESFGLVVSIQYLAMIVLGGLGSVGGAALVSVVGAHARPD